MSKPGEFEMLLSILRQRSTPYANQVRADLDESCCAVTRGALYLTLDHLTLPTLDPL